jgi:hypothetical protein
MFRLHFLSTPPPLACGAPTGNGYFSTWIAFFGSVYYAFSTVTAKPREDPEYDAERQSLLGNHRSKTNLNDSIVSRQSNISAQSRLPVPV